MKFWLIKYFGFTKREYNGLMVLMAVCMFITAFPYLYVFLDRSNNEISEKEFEAIRELKLIKQVRANGYSSVKNEEDEEKGFHKVQLFNFDPNQIDVLTWQKLGLSAKQAAAVINYRNKGGKFRKPEDLKRMYTISPEKYAAFEPYIRIENSEQDQRFIKDRFEKVPYVKKELPMIEINAADTLILDQIKGIGATFARRIVKYRERLGGFYKKEQLKEVYGIDSLKFIEMIPQVKIDESLVKKIDVNTATFDQLKSHPYLNYKQINAMIQYRKQHGKFNSIDDLKKVVIFTQENIQRLAPYLNFND